MAKPAKKDTVETPQVSFKTAFAATQKKYGSNTITIARSMNRIKRVPCGIPSLDFQLGGGLPMGRIIHVAGDNHSGKTFFSKQMTAALQKSYPDKMVFWLDVERSFDPIRAEQIGVDLDRLIVCRPASSEDGLDELIEMIPFISGAVVDSVAALTSAAEAGATMADKQVGQLAALMSKFFHKWISETSPEKVNGDVPMLVLTNQLRDDIGSYIKRTKTPGGRAMLHYPSVYIEFSRGPVVKLKEHDAEDEEVVIGHDIKFKVPKNNTFQPDKRGAFMLCTRPYKVGRYSLQVNQTDWPRDILKYAVHHEVVKKSGNWYEFSGKEAFKSNGMADAQAEIYDNGMLAAELTGLIMKEVRKIHGLKEHEDNPEVEKPRKANGEKAPGTKTTWKRK